MLKDEPKDKSKDEHTRFMDDIENMNDSMADLDEMGYTFRGLSYDQILVAKLAIINIGGIIQAFRQANEDVIIHVPMVESNAKESALTRFNSLTSSKDKLTSSEDKLTYIYILEAVVYGLLNALVKMKQMYQVDMLTPEVISELRKAPNDEVSQVIIDKMIVRNTGFVDGGKKFNKRKSYKKTKKKNFKKRKYKKSRRAKKHKSRRGTRR